MKKDRVLMMGAAGRDFHNFDVYFRDNEAHEVVVFTATQIPNIEGRVYPSELAGLSYPDGIPTYPESNGFHRRDFREAPSNRTTPAGYGLWPEAD